MPRLVQHALVSALVACSTAACSSRGPEGAAESDASMPKGDEEFSFGPAIDPFTIDASLPVRIDYVLAGCAGGPESDCHGGGAGGLHMVLTGAHADVVNVPSTERPDLFRVKPFDSPDSYLYLKLVGDGGIEGGRMPLGGPYDPRVMAIVEQWIDAGAPTE
jgi:hypothetical protein